MRKVGRGEWQCMHEYLCICACCVSVKLSICRLSAHLHNFRTHIYGTLYPGTYLALFWPPLSSATRFVCFFCCPFASHTRHAPSLHPPACPTATPILVFPIIALLIHINSLNVRRHCAFICLCLFLSLPLSLCLFFSIFVSLSFGIIIVALHSIIIRLAIISLKLLVSVVLIGIYRIWGRQLDSLTIKAESRMSSPHYAVVCRRCNHSIEYSYLRLLPETLKLQGLIRY